MSAPVSRVSRGVTVENRCGPGLVLDWDCICHFIGMINVGYSEFLNFYSGNATCPIGKGAEEEETS
jgi:hypothetical protein